MCPALMTEALFSGLVDCVGSVRRVGEREGREVEGLQGKRECGKEGGGRER